MFLRRVLLLLGVLVAATACGAAASSGETGSERTIPVGVLPSTASTSASGSDPGATVPRTTVTLPPDAQVGALVGGNRVILIGDSVLASTSRRYTDDTCEALVPLGWQVELDAETSRFIEFGNDVLDARLGAGWDAAVILLGNNYRDDKESFREELDRMVRRLSPQPVVLMTVSEFTASRVAVNEVIFDMAQLYDNVLIVDWGATTAADSSYTGGDGLHLTEKGRAALAEQVALALGPAPNPNGKCLSTSFDDDSSGSVDGSTTSTTIRRPNRTTTTKPADTTDTTDTSDTTPSSS